MFHDVKPRPQRWNLTPEMFRVVMQELKRSSSRVLVTVDDAGVGNYKYMYPILEELQLKAVFFVPTAFINDRYDRRPTYMNAAQIRELYQSGHIIGSHSHSHPANISLLSHEAVYQEWRQSKSILEDITGVAVTSCSYPGGFYHSAHLDILNRLGYTHVFNSRPSYGYNVQGNMKIVGRFSIEHDITEYGMKAILDHNRINQTYMLLRHLISNQLHTLKHRIIY